MAYRAKNNFRHKIFLGEVLNDKDTSNISFIICVCKVLELHYLWNKCVWIQYF